MDQTQKEDLIDEEMDGMEKCCADCKTTKTPLWRSGPYGPKSLCNACGIRYRKKRSTMVGLNRGVEKMKEKSSTTSSGDATPVAASGAGAGNGRDKGGELDEEDLRVRVMALGKEVVLLKRNEKKKKRSPIKKKQKSKRKLGEVEQAAVLLMALSCGSVFA